jgi:hypothetical protein
MTRIGQLLVRADLVSENHLARALGVQHFAGGRIGTLLLERGALEEDDLGKTLGQQHGCDYVPWSVLGNVSPAAIAALPVKFAIRHSAVPWDRGEGFLRIALRDPADLRILDELFFVTGRKIVPGVAPEVRIFQALEKYYGERRTPRFAILAEKLSRVAARPSARAAGPPPPPEFFPDAPARPAPIFLGGAEGGNPPDIGAVAKMPDAPVTPWAPVTPPSASSAEADEEVISWEELSPPSMWIPAPIAPAKGRGTSAPFPVPAPPAPAEPVRPPPAPAPPPIETAPAPASVPPAPEPAVAPAKPPAKPPRPSRPAPRVTPRPSKPPAKAPKPPPKAAPTPPRVAPPVPPGATRFAAETFDFPGVLAAGDRGAVVVATIDALSNRFPRAAVFGCKPDRISGLAGVGAGVDLEKVAAIDVPWADPSVFLNVRLSRSFYLGPLPPLPRHRPIAEAMGKSAEECVVQPVWIKDKPVAFLYAEFEPDRGATPMDLAYLRGLSAAAATALAASIRARRGA